MKIYDIAFQWLYLSMYKNKKKTGTSFFIHEGWEKLIYWILNRFFEAVGTLNWEYAYSPCRSFSKGEPCPAGDVAVSI